MTDESIKQNKDYELDCTFCGGVGEVEVDDEYDNPAGIPCPCCDGSGLEKDNTCYEQ